MWAGFSSSVIERKWLEAAKILFFRTRNVGKGPSVPIVPLPPLPYGGETGRENQCAMLADSTTNYTG